jgi:NADPH:quinone reductase-like Zn-dependent oxidoreductase
MRAVVLERFGEPSEVLGVGDRERREPGSGQVLVRVLASPVNPSDLMTTRGTYAKVPALPFVPGYEGVGVVEAAGGGLLPRFMVGRRVAFLAAEGGAWAESNVVSARQVVPLSRRIPIEQAAMFFVNPTTAYVLACKLLNVPKGEWLLQTAAGSAVGRMVIRLGQRFGFRTMNVVRRLEQVDELRSLGADAVIASDGFDLVEQVRRLTNGAGVTHALDCVSGELGSSVVRCLAPSGRLIVFGTMSQHPLCFSSRDLMTPGSRVEGFWLGNYMSGLSIVSKLKLVSKVGRLLRDGTLASEVGATFPLDQIRAAVARAEKPGREGKVLLKLSGPSSNDV